MKTPQSTVTKDTSSSGTYDDLWTINHSAAKAEIIATVQFAAHSVPFHATENLVACYKQQFPDSLIAKLRMFP